MKFPIQFLRYAPTENNFAGCMRKLAVGTQTIAAQQISFTQNVLAIDGVSSNGCVEEVIHTDSFVLGFKKY